MYLVGSIHDGYEVTEIAQRGSHHHRPDNYDVYSGDRLLKTVSDRDVCEVAWANLPAPAHQTFIPRPSTRHDMPPEGETWCPHTRQSCWGKACARYGHGCGGVEPQEVSAS
jgi:hypothetical protein